MVKIKILATGEVQEVTKNQAHSLIDSGKAVLHKEEPKKTNAYNTRQMRPSVTK